MPKKNNCKFSQPGAYIEELDLSPRPIEGVPISTVGMIGETEKGPTEPMLITSWGHYKTVFGGCFGHDKYLPYAVKGFFDDGGERCYVVKIGDKDYISALNKLAIIDEIGLLYAPDALKFPGLAEALVQQCETLKDRFAIIDSPQEAEIEDIDPPQGIRSSYAAYYYPWVTVTGLQADELIEIPPGGHVAGIYARSDRQRGVHKAPANEEVNGIVGLTVQVGQPQQDLLNPKGINVIRSFPGRGIRVWGARTLSADVQWKYINVRRLIMYLEKSIKRGIAWSVFEPNNEKLWSKLKMAVTEFLTRVWRGGALLGNKPEEAFFVRVDRSTMTQADIEAGRIIILVGVAPFKPAEFIVFRVSHQR